MIVPGVRLTVPNHSGLLLVYCEAESVTALLGDQLPSAATFPAILMVSPYGVVTFSSKVTVTEVAAAHDPAVVVAALLVEVVDPEMTHQALLRITKTETKFSETRHVGRKAAAHDPAVLVGALSVEFAGPETSCIRRCSIPTKIKQLTKCAKSEEMHSLTCDGAADAAASKLCLGIEDTRQTTGHGNCKVTV